MLLVLLLGVSIATLFPPLHALMDHSSVYEGLQDSIYLLAAVLVAARVWLIRHDRLAWALLAGGLLSYGVGNVVYYAVVQHIAPEPFPSVSDALWLPLYPALYAAALLLVRQQIRAWQGSQWLDGLVASLGAAAVVTAFLLKPVMGAATGSGADVAVNLAYPAADLLLLMLIVTVFAVTGWRPGRRWWLLGIGMALFAVADVVYLVQLGVGSFQPGTWLDDVWLVGVVAMALASWVSSGRTVAAELHGGLRLLAVPMLFAASSLAVLAAQALQPSRGSLTVTILCVTTIVVALLRTSLSFREVRALADAQRLARTDDLTGLPNRRQLLAQIDCVMSARGSAAQAAVLLIDLDRFKEVNDSFGHDVGDNLLRLISNRLEQAMPGGAMLARMGGDEFGVLLPNTDEATAVHVAQQVNRQLAFPFALQGLRLHVEASAGIALAPAHGTSSSALLQHADVAMYESKRTRLSHVVFEPSKHSGARRRLETVEQFRAGLDSGELVLHYQPQLGLQSGAVVGFESLLRWLHPERGLLYPDQFLGLAEKAGLMDRVVDHVLKQALRDVQIWRQEFPGLTVAVNLSASNLQDAAFPAVVMRHLHEVGLPPAVLTLEITENVLMVDAAQAQAVLAQL
ncbi:MAG TPA: diguanylate cyclase, partial [Actinomycetes bacterium]